MAVFVKQWDMRLPGDALKGGGVVGLGQALHPAAKLLPAPGSDGSSAAAAITFRENEHDEEEVIEVKHQAEDRFYPHQEGRPLYDGEGPPGPFVMPKPSLGNVYSPEQLKEWGYPEYDPKFQDTDWLREQLRKEREDPRENANFFLSPTMPEYWHNAARKPYVKALLEQENHWSSRKNGWLQQLENVSHMNAYRETVVEQLEECSSEAKRLLAPILKHRIVEVFLTSVLEDSKQKGTPFSELIESKENMKTMHHFRQTIDLEGDRGAEELYNAWETRAIELSRDEAARKEREAKLNGRADVTDMASIKDALNLGSKCKQDGLLEWQKGNYEAALKSWREGHEALWRVKAPDVHAEENALLSDLHLATLKNLAQAAIKVGRYTEALDAADMALRIDDQDHKAWFRKACALEGLGRFSEIRPCLEAIDDIAVGRPDCERLKKDTEAKREQLKAREDKDDVVQARMLERGVQESLFSEERDTKPIQDYQSLAGPPKISQTVKVAKIDDATRKRLTRDGAEDLLRALERAYEDKTFRAQVKKLGRDVTDLAEFIAYLNHVALPIQKPILEKWGFDASAGGVVEMRRAIQDHTQGQKADSKLQAQAEQTMRALYGEFYHVARGAGLRPEARAPVPPSRSRIKKNGGDDESDEEGDATAEGQAYGHWTGRARSTYDGGLDVMASTANIKRKYTAKEKKEIWNALSKAMPGNDRMVLRECLERAIAAGFSSVTLRSAKMRLALIGGHVDDLGI